MKVINTVIYESVDGKQFKTSAECLSHEGEYFRIVTPLSEWKQIPHEGERYREHLNLYLNCDNIPMIDWRYWTNSSPDEGEFVFRGKLAEFVETNEDMVEKFLGVAEAFNKANAYIKEHENEINE